MEAHRAIIRKISKKEAHTSSKLKFLKCCNFTKSNDPPCVFFTFLKCTNVNKSCKASYLIMRSTKIINVRLSPSKKNLFNHNVIVVVWFHRMFSEDIF